MKAIISIILLFFTVNLFASPISGLISGEYVGTGEITKYIDGVAKTERLENCIIWIDSTGKVMPVEPRGKYTVISLKSCMFAFDSSEFTRVLAISTENNQLIEISNPVHDVKILNSTVSAGNLSYDVAFINAINGETAHLYKTKINYNDKNIRIETKTEFHDLSKEELLEKLEVIYDFKLKSKF